MPLTEQERQEILSRRAPTAPSLPNTNAQAPASQAVAPGMELQSVTIRDGKPTTRFAPPKPAAKPRPIPQGQLVVLESTDKAITRLQKLIQVQQEKQYKTGPMSPRFYSGNLGNVAMQYAGSPEERVFKAENQRFTNDYITAQTGAQRGFKEVQWLQNAIPNPAQDTPENYLANAQSALEDLQRNKTQMLQTLKDAGYRVPEAEGVDDPNILKLQQQFPGAKIRKKP